MNMSFWQEMPQNASNLTTLVSAFLCPSDGNVPCGTYAVSGPGARQIGYTSYPNNLGTIPTGNGDHYDGPAYFMGVGGNVTVADITDGTSSTALWSEMVRGRNGTTIHGPNQVYLMAVPLPNANSLAPLVTYLKACKGATSLSGFDYKGRIWGTDYGAEGGGYSHIMTPNQNACIFQGQQEARPIEWLPMCVGPSSFHPGGVNVGFLDGSVRFIKDSVNQQTWWGIATKAGGEVIDASSL
jgi:prepilin-type processing-associated H-X9-DG protein